MILHSAIQTLLVRDLYKEITDRPRQRETAGDRQTQTGKQTAGEQTDRQTGRRTNGPTRDRWTDKQTSRQAETDRVRRQKQTDGQTDSLMAD